MCGCVGVVGGVVCVWLCGCVLDSFRSKPVYALRQPYIDIILVIWIPSNPSSPPFILTLHLASYSFQVKELPVGFDPHTRQPVYRTEMFCEEITHDDILNQVRGEGGRRRKGEGERVKEGGRD